MLFAYLKIESNEHFIKIINFNNKPHSEFKINDIVKAVDMDKKRYIIIHYETYSMKYVYKDKRGIKVNYFNPD